MQKTDIIPSHPTEDAQDEDFLNDSDRSGLAEAQQEQANQKRQAVQTPEPKFYPEPHTDANGGGNCVSECIRFLRSLSLEKLMVCVKTPLDFTEKLVLSGYPGFALIILILIFAAYRLSFHNTKWYDEAACYLAIGVILAIASYHSMESRAREDNKKLQCQVQSMDAKHCEEIKKLEKKVKDHVLAAEQREVKFANELRDKEDKHQADIEWHNNQYEEREKRLEKRIENLESNTEKNAAYWATQMEEVRAEADNRVKKVEQENETLKEKIKNLQK